ncbi:MAG TPA: hypothetical protein VH186_25885 [Chloroflexia bacterium]|nr:hypothetical protein [Chloroflexia bacterium]
MELILGFLLVIALLALFSFASLRWGANSRGQGRDWQPHQDYEFYTPGKYEAWE